MHGIELSVVPLVHTMKGVGIHWIVQKHNMILLVFYLLNFTIKLVAGIALEGTYSHTHLVSFHKHKLHLDVLQSM